MLFPVTLSFTVDKGETNGRTVFNFFREKKNQAREFPKTENGSDNAVDIAFGSILFSSFQILNEIRDEEQRFNYLTSETRIDFPENNLKNSNWTVFPYSVLGGQSSTTVASGVAKYSARIRFLETWRQKDDLPSSFTISPDSDSHTVDSGTTLPINDRLETRPVYQYLTLFSMPDLSSLVYFGRANTESLNEGDYSLSILTPGDTSTYFFTYTRADRLRTLNDLSLTISSLKYTTTDSVMSDINSGDDEEIAEKFSTYWKSLHLTPPTDSNEPMAEFYRRAAFAYHEIKTTRLTNDTLTDSGGAYIPWGKSQAIEREFRTEGTFEIWTCRQLNRVLVFRQQGFGDLKMYQTEKP